MVNTDLWLRYNLNSVLKLQISMPRLHFNSSLSLFGHLHCILSPLKNVVWQCQIRSSLLPFVLGNEIDFPGCSWLLRRERKEEAHVSSIDQYVHLESGSGLLAQCCEFIVFIWKVSQERIATLSSSSFRLLAEPKEIYHRKQEGQ